MEFLRQAWEFRVEFEIGMASWAFHGTRGGSLSELYGKEEQWFLSSLTRNQAVQPDHADYGSTPMRIPTTLQSSSSLQSSLARIESLPALRIREQERDPISGLMPSESRAVHDWTSSMRASHGRLPMTRREPSVGDVTKFGVKDECTGAQSPPAAHVRPERALTDVLPCASQAKPFTCRWAYGTVCPRPSAWSVPKPCSVRMRGWPATIGDVPSLPTRVWGSCSCTRASARWRGRRARRSSKISFGSARAPQASGASMQRYATSCRRSGACSTRVGPHAR